MRCKSGRMIIVIYSLIMIMIRYGLRLKSLYSIDCTAYWLAQAQTLLLSYICSISLEGIHASAKTISHEEDEQWGARLNSVNHIYRLTVMTCQHQL